MKRHSSLFALSHHHQHVLVQAKKLGRVTDQVGEAKRLELARGFLTLWIPAGIHHFRQEEEILLPAMARYSGLDHPFYAHLQRDHLEIRSLIDSISDALHINQTPIAEALSRLGQLLDAHIRFEEHEVFPFAESLFPEEDLERIRIRMEEDG
jgi:hemerythrin-like domain-containing protein